MILVTNAITRQCEFSFQSHHQTGNRGPRISVAPQSVRPVQGGLLLLSWPHSGLTMGSHTALWRSGLSVRLAHGPGALLLGLSPHSSSHPSPWASCSHVNSAQHPSTGAGLWNPAAQPDTPNASTFHPLLEAWGTCQRNPIQSAQASASQVPAHVFLRYLQEQESGCSYILGEKQDSQVNKGRR